MPQVYLLTGRPGTGKTSLIKTVLTGLSGRAGGFYTEEIREQGRRLGFKLVTLDGAEVVLAHVSLAGPYRVSRYGVDVAALERVGVAALRRAAAQDALVVVDEIGKMELLSAEFREMVVSIIDDGKKLLGTIMQAPHPRADELKRRPEVRTVTLTTNNRAEVLRELNGWLQDIFPLEASDTGGLR